MPRITKLTPSARLQWSLFFAVVLVLMSWGSYVGVYEISGAIVGGFLVFYFPMTWVYRFDFLERVRGLRRSKSR